MPKSRNTKATATPATDALVTPDMLAEAARLADATPATDAPASEQADAPATDAPAPEQLTARARHQAYLADNASRGIKLQQRARTNIVVATSGTKTITHHAPGANYLGRFVAVTQQTRDFVCERVRERGFEPFAANPDDAGKLARAIAAGLMRFAGDTMPGTTKAGLPGRTNLPGQPLLVAVNVPDCDLPAFGFKLPKAD